MNNPNELIGRYVALWNEPDAEVRRQAIRDLWAQDGVHRLQPPQDLHEAAAALGFATTLEARGHEALEARVARAHEEFVASGQFVFRPRDDGARLDDLVKFRWEMVPAGGGDVAAVGLELLLLDAEGRIRADYQFIEA